MKKILLLSISLVAVNINNIAIAGGGPTNSIEQTGNSQINNPANQTNSVVSNPDIFGQQTGFNPISGNNLGGSGVGLGGSNLSNPGTLNNPVTPLQSFGQGFNNNSTGLGNNQFFGSTTSTFSASQSGSSQCGLSLYGEINNGNTEVATVYKTGFNFNTAKCPNYSKIESKRQEEETKRVKMSGQTSVINTCIQARAIAIQSNTDPEITCKVPDFSTAELFK